MYQLTLSNTEFEGNNSIYLLGVEGSGPVTLVDTGVATPAVETELERRIENYGVTVPDIDRILLTHWHHDHAGLAGAIQARSGATVFAHEADAPLIRNDQGAIQALHERQTAALDEWGMPEEPRAELLAFLEKHAGLRGEAASVTEIQEGDGIQAGPWKVDTVHLPGHAAGLVGYRFQREGRTEAFLGDAVLPKYTPNVGGADIRVERPLGSYLNSLRRVIEMDLDRAWPGHRGPLIDPAGRARDIIEHHEKRTARVIEALQEEGSMTPWEVSSALFGGLENIHILHGPGEAFAHLEHLREAGVVEREGRNYTLSGGITRNDALETLRH